MHPRSWPYQPHIAHINMNIILFCTNVTFHFTLLSTKKISLCALCFLHLRAASLTHKNPQGDNNLGKNTEKTIQNQYYYYVIPVIKLYTTNTVCNNCTTLATSFSTEPILIFLKSLMGICPIQWRKVFLGIGCIDKKPYKLILAWYQNCCFYISQNKTASTYKLMLVQYKKKYWYCTKLTSKGSRLLYWHFSTNMMLLHYFVKPTLLLNWLFY